MTDRRFPQRLHTEGFEPEPGKSCGYYCGNTELFDLLLGTEKTLAKLQPDELAQIRASSVGVILKFHELKFSWSAGVVHHMLSLQLVCDKPNEIWSLIGVNPVRLSLVEFAEITGLQCHPVDKLMTPETKVTEATKDFWRLLGVNQEMGPSIKDLIAAAKKCQSWARVDRIRLGYLALYVGYIDAQKRVSGHKC